MGLAELHPRILKELADVLAKSLSVICQHFWVSGQVPVGWRVENVTLLYKKGQRKDPGNYRPVSLTSVPEKVNEKIILSVITHHIQTQPAWVYEG